MLRIVDEWPEGKAVGRGVCGGETGGGGRRGGICNDG